MFNKSSPNYELLPTSSAENSPPPSRISLPSNHSDPAQTFRNGKAFRISAPSRKTMLISAAVLICIIIFVHQYNPFESQADRQDESLISTISPSTFAGDSKLPPPLSRQAKFDKTLDEVQCQREFPAFYPQLRLNRQIWTEKGGIGKKEIDRAEKEADKGWGYARIIIKDGQLYIRTLYPGFQSRIYALLELIHDSLQSAPRSYLEQLKPLDLVFVSADKNGFDAGSGDSLFGGRQGAGWRVNEKVEDSGKGTWLMPDFGFGAWPEAGIPSWEEFMLNAEKLENRLGWSGKDERGLWRGWADVYPTRQDLLDRTYRKKGTESWNDVGQTTFHNDVGDFKDLHFHAALDSNSSSPSQNLVELKGPLFEGLEETMAELWASDESRNPKFPLKHFELSHQLKQSGAERKWLGNNGAQQIADNAARTLRDRYLTPSATNCYLRSALLAYSQTLDQGSWGHQGPSPRPGDGVAADGGRHLSEEEMKQKGVKGDINYKTWVLSRLNQWPLNP